jgi:hypothetical protein
MQTDVAQTLRRSKDSWSAIWQSWQPHGDSGQHGVAGDDLPTGMRLSRDRGCRSRFSSDDWAQRVKQRTVGFDAAAGSTPSSDPHRSMRSSSSAHSPSSALGGATARSAGSRHGHEAGGPREPPPRPVHELDTVDRYDAKEHRFHFC